MIDRRPGLIVRSRSAADVLACVQFAREHGLLVSVRGGGHSVAGSCVCDDGLVIDLSSMRAVQVDAEARTVRVEAGATIGDLDRQTQPHGLAVPMGVVTETGVAGLTLGGGLGWLRRKYGLSCDNLLAAEVVIADGSVVTADAQADPALLWALQGGGGDLGVVTSFVFRAHPVGPDVFFAFIVHSAADTPAALKFFREWEATAPDEVSSFAILWHAPELAEIPAEHHHKPIGVFLAMHCGDPAVGAGALEPLRAFGRPLADLSATMPYLEVQRFFDEDYPAHDMRYYWKSSYLDALPDELIDLLVRLNADTPSAHSTIDLWQLGGQVGRPAPGATAFGGRSHKLLVGIEANWESPQDDGACIEWARGVHRALEPFSAGGGYVNFPGFYEEGEKMLQDTYGPNLDRLRALKRRYDPGNMFRLNPNVAGR